MKHYTVTNELGCEVWSGFAMSADFALIRAYKTLGFETYSQWRASKVELIIREVKNEDENFMGTRRRRHGV